MASLWGRRTLVTTVCVASAWALIGCATPNQAPVEDHSAKLAHAAAPAGDTNKNAATTPLPAAESRASTYTVQPGDMLTKIGMDTGQAWRDLARWNNLADPNHLEVGQVLRVLPPAGDVPPGSTVTTTTTTTTAPATFKPLPPIPNKPDAKASAATTAPAIAAGSAVPLTGAATPQPATPRDDDDLTWAWPASGPVVAPFDDAKTKGLAIGGKAGDPVFAAADGRVVYAGSGLRGYGNLVIVKHNANYLTAYAHNQALLVKEDQIVKRGQKIAEMGSTDADRVQLHFEIRKQGKPIDPARLLPPR
jgi:lipoprotein NlpD